jgi:DNA-directed RNA polymerase specialized sigma24 family protein
LPAVTQELRAYLHRRLPSLRDHHEDILNETLAALVEQLQRHSSVFPEAWFTPVLTATNEDCARFHRLAMTILMRRIADLFRARASEWGRRVSDYDFNITPDQTNLERKALLRQMLQICVEVLANTPEEDRALLALVAGEDQRSQSALQPSERQRLRRLRLKLAEEISHRLGATVSELLREVE